MLRRAVLLLISTMAVASAQPVQPIPATSFPVDINAPSVTLSNGHVRAKVYLQGGTRPFYHGTRFDQAGVVGSLMVGGQEFYGPWFERTAPDVLDYVNTPGVIIAGPDSAVSGPVEEFNSDGKALGYDEAKVGGTFIKIGVGILRKADDKPYDHYRHYEIVDGGKRTVTHTKSSVTFSQTLKDTSSGYGYEYRKALALVPGQPQLTIAHNLRNTGTKPIVTQVYDHNFLRLSPGNADLVVTLPYTVKAAELPPAAVIKVEGNRIAFVRPLTGDERHSFLFTGYGADARDYDFTIANARTGASVRTQGDRPVTRLNLFSVRSVMALEPYNDLAVAPGADIAWTYTYTYTAPRH